MLISKSTSVSRNHARSWQLPNYLINCLWSSPLSRLKQKKTCFKTHITLLQRASWSSFELQEINHDQSPQIHALNMVGLTLCYHRHSRGLRISLFSSCHSSWRSQTKFCNLAQHPIWQIVQTLIGGPFHSSLTYFKESHHDFKIPMQCSSTNLVFATQVEVTFLPTIAAEKFLKATTCGNPLYPVSPRIYCPH